MSPGHDGPTPLPSTSLSQINTSSPRFTTAPSNAFYRYSTLLAIEILKRVRPRKGNVLMLTDRFCVKYGELVQLSEASTLRFISQNTSIPVPKVYCAFEHAGINYIVMERIQGHIIGRGWVDRSEESKAKLLSQLSKMVYEMRSLPCPEGTKIASIEGGPLYDSRVPGQNLCFGPFETLQDFHRYLRMDMECDEQSHPDARQFIEQYNRTWPLVFTHGDLSSLNIMVRGDEIVGIVDWETAGWYPSYWEYTTASQVNPQNSFWIHEIDKFLEPMPDELAMERTRWELFGNF